MPIAARVGVAIVLVLLALIVLAGGIGMLGAAVYLAVAEIAPPATAAVVTGLAGVAAALLFVGVAALVGGGGRRRRERRPDGEAGMSHDAAAELGRLAGARAQAALSARPWVGPAVALAAGFAYGASPALRRFVRRQLR
ncbi:MAG: hypothetical protein EA406_09555 [Rhodospirillales bacterium]|nr:MAG: hypothetical protein EA406_09555 [Rhodospirillales bacterium]